MGRFSRGLVHIYTGDGKGKTTAALGLALRAVGAGLKVSIYQFIKGKIYSEIEIIKKLKNIKLEQCGRGCFIKGRPEMEDAKCAKVGIMRARRDIASGKHDLVILDEINVALKLGLVKPKVIIDIIKRKPHFVELVLTGRHCPKALLKYADLVTEMRKIKHPFDKGVLGRKGIEY